MFFPSLKFFEKKKKSKPDFKNCHESCFTFYAYRMQNNPSLDFPPKQMKAAAI